MNLKEYVRDIFNSHHIDLKDKHIGVATSGGVDSMVLLSLMLELRSEFHFSLYLLHCNHHVRSESADEALYLKEYALKNDITFLYKDLYLDLTHSYEAEAHDKRYAFFKGMGATYQLDYILLAHHSEDNLESILIRIGRGSGLKGYLGLPFKNTKDNLTYLRPLLNIRKEDIIYYSEENNITYFHDKTNDTDESLRNRLRHYAIPALLDNNIDKGLERYQYVLSSSYNEIQKIIQPFINKVKENQCFSKSEFLNYSDFLKEEILYKIIKDSQDITNYHMHEVIKELGSSKPYYQIKISHYVLDMQNDIVYIKENINNTPNSFTNINTCVINDYGEYALNDNLSLIVSKKINLDMPKIAYLWYNIKELPIIVRGRKIGDTITDKSGTHKLKSILINQHATPKEKEECVVLEKNGQVLAVLGYARAETANLKDNEGDSVIYIKRR